MAISIPTLNRNKFIEEVKRHRILYDPDDSDFNDHDKISYAWVAIAKKLGYGNLGVALQNQFDILVQQHKMCKESRPSIIDEKLSFLDAYIAWKWRPTSLSPGPLFKHQRVTDMDIPFSNLNRNQFIEEVKRHRILYDPKDSDFNMHNKTSSTWKRIANNLRYGNLGAVLQKQFDILVEQQEMNKMSTPSIIDEELLFLNDYIAWKRVNCTLTEQFLHRLCVTPPPIGYQSPYTLSPRSSNPSSGRNSPFDFGNSNSGRKSPFIGFKEYHPIPLPDDCFGMNGLYLKPRPPISSGKQKVQNAKEISKKPTKKDDAKAKGTKKNANKKKR